MCGIDKKADDEEEDDEEEEGEGDGQKKQCSWTTNGV